MHGTKLTDVPVAIGGCRNSFPSRITKTLRRRGMFDYHFCRLWRDDSGSVIAAEYLALAGIVALGGVAGLESMRSATVDEAKEVGSSIRAMNQSYHIKGQTTNSAT